MTAVQTLDRAVAILNLFEPDHPEWAAAEVARELGLTLPTTSRLMRALQDSGLLMRVEGRRFRLGFGAVDLGFRALQSIDVRERLHSILRRLARESGETTVLGVVNEARDAVRVVDRVEGRDAIRITLDIGHTWPLHAGALAKALLAFMPDRRSILEQPLVRVGRATITDRRALELELEQIRACGWASSAEETELGAWGVAKPVLDAHGQPLAALLLVTPVGRRSAENTRRMIGHLDAVMPDARSRLGVDAGPR